MFEIMDGDECLSTASSYRLASTILRALENQAAEEMSDHNYWISGEHCDAGVNYGEEGSQPYQSF